MARWDDRQWSSRAWRRGLAVAAVLLGGEVLAHGVWLRLGTLHYAASTQTLLQNNVAAGIGGFAAGDLMTIEGHFPVGGNNANSGPGGYVTAYVPGGTEVVGAWIIDAAGTPVPARPATSAQSGEGIAKGWGPLGSLTFVTGVNAWNPSPLPAACTTSGKTAATCMSGLSAIYGDTGIFYSTRADTALYTGDGSGVISLTNGYQVNPTSNQPWADLGAAGQERIHNRWDAVQSNAFGAGTGGPVTNAGFTTAESTPINTTGRGGTPYLGGSPVAGPDAGVPWDRAATAGPWRRVSYPGSCFASAPTPLPATSAGGTGADPVTAVNSVSVCTPTSSGVSLNTAAPLPAGTNAVRFAVGGITLAPVQETVHVRLTLRVTDPSALTPANMEGSGGDSTQGAKAGNDNPWRYWVGAVATPRDAASLALGKRVVAVNGVPVSGALPPIAPGSTVRYRLTYANTWLRPQTSVVLRDTLPTQVTGISNVSVVSGPNVLPFTPTAPTGGSTLSFTAVSLGPGQGGAVEFDAVVNGPDGQTVTNTATLQSTQLATPVSTSAAFPLTAQADLRVTKTGPLYAHPGSDLSYTLSVHNAGPNPASAVTLTDTLPGAVTYRSSTPAAAVGGQTLGWSWPSLAVGATQTVSVTVSAPDRAALEASASARVLLNSASVGSATLDPRPGDNAASARTELVYAHLGKRVRNVTQGGVFGVAGAGRPGEVLEYCLDFRNLGGAALHDFTLADPMPPGTGALTDAYGTDLGIRVSRGPATTLLTSTAADTDGASLGHRLSVTLGTLLAEESGWACFQVGIR